MANMAESLHFFSENKTSSDVHAQTVIKLEMCGLSLKTETSCMLYALSTYRPRGRGRARKISSEGKKFVGS